MKLGGEGPSAKKNARCKATLPTLCRARLPYELYELPTSYSTLSITSTTVLKYTYILVGVFTNHLQHVRQVAVSHWQPRLLDKIWNEILQIL